MMESDLIVQAVQLAVKKWPGITPYLSRKARHAMGDMELKTYDYYLRALRGLVVGLYRGYLGGEFNDIMADLVFGQFTDAYEQAMKDNEVEDMSPEMRTELDGLISAEWEFVRGFFEDIVNARVDNTPIDPLLSRAELWANKWNDVYNKATMTIEVMYGGKLKWILGATEEHCATCAALNGIVAWARDWQELDIHPQNPPNEKLQCSGFRCDCSLEHTDEKRTRNGRSRLEEIAGG